MLTPKKKTTLVNNDNLFTKKVEYKVLGIRFKLRNNFIYYTIGNGRERLYIFYSFKVKVFRLSYNLFSYRGFYRIYNRLFNSVYIR